MHIVTVEGRTGAWSRDAGAGTAQRRLPGGGRTDAVRHVPFAFASGAPYPDAPVRHVE